MASRQLTSGFAPDQPRSLEIRPLAGGCGDSGDRCAPSRPATPPLVWLILWLIKLDLGERKLSS